jgi:hypothetical protein
MNKKSFFSLFSFCLFTTFHLFASVPAFSEGQSDRIYIERVQSAKIVSLKSDQQKYLFKRAIVKNSLYGAAIIGAIYLVKYSMNYKINEAGSRASNILGDAQKKEAEKGWIHWLKSVPGQAATMFKVAVPALISGKILDYGWSKISKAISDPIRDESLYWFYYNHTKISDLIDVIKLHSVPLDPDSFYLDYETNQMGQKVALQAFMEEVKVAVSSEDNFLKALLPQRTARKHVRQAKYLAALEDDALITEGMKQCKMFVADSEKNADNAQNRFSRSIIQSFVFKLKSDIEKLLSFALARHTVLTIENDMVQQLIALTNKYIQDVEDLLNLSDEELAVASQEKRGLFTKIFDFTKYFNDCFKTMNVCLNWQ